MRELKFRVWSEEDKEYRSDIKISDSVVDIEGIPSTIYNDEDDRFDIEQFTGLKDKNGKEIYEGDIVGCILGNKPVEFHDCRYWLGETLDDLFAANLRYDIEVIGNIHENEDLLKGGEPKEWWTISGAGYLWTTEHMSPDTINDLRQIGNLFDTKEEAEKAMERLRAWKRLKDKGFRFNGKEVFSEGLLEIDGILSALEGADNAERLKIIDDLDLLFCAEDEE